MLDESAVNPWYGMFSQEWLDGSWAGADNADKKGDPWEQRHRSFQRYDILPLDFAGQDSARKRSIEERVGLGKRGHYFTGNELHF